MPHPYYAATPGELGFLFGNHFAWEKGAVRIAYGLCGGMCFAALDLWYAGLAVPFTKEPPPWGSPFYWYLVKRQWDSWHGLKVPLRALGWMMLSDQTIAHHTLAELGPVLKYLTRGEPQVLLLLRTKGINLTMNHQVVAIGYQRLADALLRLALYDPNHPTEEVSLWVDTREEALPVARQSTGEPLRGFFRIAYKPRRRKLDNLF